MLSWADQEQPRKAHAPENDQELRALCDCGIRNYHAGANQESGPAQPGRQSTALYRRPIDGQHRHANEHGGDVKVSCAISRRPDNGSADRPRLPALSMAVQKAVAIKVVPTHMTIAPKPTATNQPAALVHHQRSPPTRPLMARSMRPQIR
jgi:hypothetical protein